jgi:hypothetical protein
VSLLRCFVARFAALCLACQLAGVAAVPFAWIAAANLSVTECTCAHGVGGVCPMHHKPAARTGICVMQSATDHASLTTMTGAAIAALVPCIAPVPHVLTSRPVAVLALAFAFARSVPPDPPPPRA